jgi:uncharacterized YccA/Bax inhibitor family protein
MANPLFSEESFDKAIWLADESETMTIKGTNQKITLLLFLTFASTAFSWSLIIGGSSLGALLIPVGAIGGLAVAITLSFKMEWASKLAPVYAILEGVFLGGISFIFQQYALMAFVITVAIVLSMLGIYTSRLIRVTQRLKFGIIAATASIALFYVMAMVLRMFGIDIPFLHEGGIVGIGFSLVVIGVAAFNLLLDFDLIEQGVRMRAPKYMEWYAAFGLLVTIIWLYVEVLKLLAKLSRRN